ncbi:glutaredoxin 3 [Bradyrhizobium sp. LHD-71]|uniref:glutaredoxin 3 n=1 Tax=Bradyrhizobium sp. LHD-71 TaxID=3072141 RepID=UPI00280CEC7B|nr:glutaredoxin 3 [Bradyrhizobium sp. LHD-71]MDQ8732064.1 glutaredoxin 3 [Bradyrhizobium sp. LHD-71]
MTAQVEIYTTPYCGYCRMAKQLLTRKDVAYTEIDVSGNPALRQTMVERAGGRTTVPQIFVRGVHVGGCDDLYELNDAGKLDKLLAGEAVTP